MDPPQGPPDQPDQNDRPNHPMPPAPPGALQGSSGLNRLGDDVSPSQLILPAVVVPSPPAILTNPEAEENDEELELPHLEQEETTHPVQKNWEEEEETR